MMKKIKSIKQLQAEKQRLFQRQLVLERDMLHNWSRLKMDLNPTNIIKDTLIRLIRNKTSNSLDNESILKSAFTYGGGLLAKRFADGAEKKFNSFFKK